jgi:DNA-binding transcriptional LysR family regulator
VPGLGDLRAFVTVAEERSLRHAADRLHVAQQDVSASIARLERELGVALLERTSTPLRLTSAGAALFSDAPAVLAAADAAFARARGHGRGLAGSLAVGVTATVGPGVLDHALTRLRRDAPALSVALREVRSREVPARLRDRSLDVVIARGLRPAPGLEVVELPPTPAALVVPEGHPLAAREVVALAALDGERLLTWSPPFADALVALCRSAGAHVEPVESSAGAGLTELVPLGAVALVPVRWPRVHGAVRVPLAGDVTLPLIAVRAAGPATPSAARLIEALQR